MVPYLSKFHKKARFVAGIGVKLGVFAALL